MLAGYFDSSQLNSDLFPGKIVKSVAMDAKVSSFSTPVCDVFFSGDVYNSNKFKVDSTASYAQLIAHLYEQKGISLFGEIDGSFIAVVKTVDKIIVARDHHGTGGQLYYSQRCFATTLALVLKMSNERHQVNSHALAHFLTVGYIPTGTSSFEGISKLAAGHVLICEKGRLTCVNMFDTSSILPSNRSADIDTLSSQYGELHLNAIKRRIRSSNNVGILLSGGYDSGCNLAGLRKVYQGDIHSYSIGFKGDNWSELPLAKCMSETFGSIHHEYEIDENEINALPDIVRELGDPFVEGGLMVNYVVMRMIGNNKPDVILGGDGSDQYFGTSGREVALHFLAAKFGLKPFMKLGQKILSSPRFETNSAPYRVRFHLNKILNILQGDLFGFEPFLLSRLINDRSAINGFDLIKPDLRSFEHLYTQHAYKSDLEKIINQVILFKASRMADMFGNPIAFPYMDLELYHFLQQLPVSLKCRGENVWQIAKGNATAKFLLKYHYKPMLPEVITSKKKQGGFAPMPIFFADKNQRDRLSDFIMSSSVADGFLNRCEVERFLKRYDSEASEQGNWFWYKQNKAIQFFNLLNLAIWWEQFVNSNDSLTL
ncbi:MAG: asparagine synthase-related protein [Bacteroidales bacterium]